MSWIQKGQDIDGEAAFDNSGISVSINSIGDRVAIGAPYNNGSGSSAGSTRVYEYNGSSWIKLGQDIDGEAAGDNGGISVSINSVGDRVAIGAYFNDGSGSNAGSTRVYEYNGSSWIKLGQDIDGEAVGDRSGVSVSINSVGDRVAIGAYLNDGSGSNAGSTRVYEYNGSSWVQLGQDINGEAASDFSGYSVSMNSVGDRVAIGAYQNDGSGSNAGSTRVYEYNGSSWVQLGQDINGEAASDFSGYSVSINSVGDRVAIGAYGNDGSGSDAGSTRVYEYNGSSWIKLGQDIDGEAAFDNSGISVSINSVGDRVAIGAYVNDGSGSDAGSTRVYEYNGSSWIKLGQDIDGEAAGDQSGVSVSMNSVGNLVAIGAPYNNGSGSYSGSTRVYKYDTTKSWNLNSNGNWNDPNNWLPVGVPVSGDDVVISINSAVARTITLPSGAVCNTLKLIIDGTIISPSAASINLVSGSLTISGSIGDLLTSDTKGLSSRQKTFNISSSLTFNNVGTNTVNCLGTMNLTGNVSFNGFKKTGTGTLNISGPTTNTGNTIVTSGIFVANPNFVITNLICSNCTIKGNGASIQNITSLGYTIISPGASPGLLSFATMTLVSTDTLEWEINVNSTSIGDRGASPDGYDAINCTGLVDLGGCSLKVILLLGVDLNVSPWNMGSSSWLYVDTENTIIGTIGSVTVDSSEAVGILNGVFGYLIDSGMSLRVTYVSNNLPPPCFAYNNLLQFKLPEDAVIVKKNIIGDKWINLNGLYVTNNHLVKINDEIIEAKESGCKEVEESHDVVDIITSNGRFININGYEVATCK